MYTQGPKGSAGLPTDDKPTPPLTGNLGGPGNQNGTTRSVLGNNQSTDVSSNSGKIAGAR